MDDAENTKHPVKGTMVVKAYPVLTRAVEEGFRRGWHRAHKHTDEPTLEQIEDNVVTAIMGDICEVFTFPETEE